VCNVGLEDGETEAGEEEVVACCDEEGREDY
jgi:hypothetical protein